MRKKTTPFPKVKAWLLCCLLLLLSNNFLAQQASKNVGSQMLKQSGLSKDVADFRQSLNVNRSLLGAKQISQLEVKAQSEVEKSPLEKMVGKREDLSLRNANSRTYINDDGTYTAVIGAGPIHYHKNGKWEEIDTKITKSTNTTYGYANVTNMMESYFADSSAQGVMSKTQEGQVQEFLNTKMYWEVNGQKTGEILGANVSAEVQNDKLYYRNLFGTISAEFSVLTGKRKLNYIIPNKEALGSIPVNAEYLVFSEDIVLPTGWKYELKGEQVLVFDGADKLIFVYHAPVLFEGYNEENFSISRVKSTLVEVHNNGASLTYVLKVKAEWLTDASRVFPIGIDPTISLVPDNTTYMSGLCDESGFGYDDLLQIGYWYGDEVDGYVRFNLSAIPAGSTVTSATTGLYRYNAQGTMSNNRYYAVGGSDFDPRDWLYYTLVGWFDYYYYLDIFDSFTGLITDYVSTSFNTNNQYKTNTLNATGNTYIQNRLPNGYVNMLFFPNGNSWSPTGGLGNYGLFRGYSAAVAQKPYLNVTYTMGCTAAGSTSSTRYISNVRFLGTLNPDTNTTSTYTIGGYANNMALPNRAKQIPGGGINVYVNTVSPAGQDPNYIKAWVDWNKDGIFDPITEKVFDSGSILTSSTTFGIIVPLATVAGSYNIRIRNYYFNYTDDLFGYYFGPCGSRPNGETEDYTFEVIADCAAKITAVNTVSSHGHRCGTGSVTLSALGSGTSYQWYTTEFGATAIPGATSANYTTPSISSTTTYYVTAVSAGCSSVKRTPVIARIDPTPVISFATTVPEICGDVSSVVVTSSGDKEEVTLVNENFETGTGGFVVSNISSNGTTVDNQTQWQIKNSTFKPAGAVWFPAINSGTVNNKFFFAMSDVAPPTSTPYTINTALTRIVPSTADFLNLRLSFDSYYSYFGTTGEGLFVEVSINGSTWITPPVQSYTSDIGIGTRFETRIVDLSAYINQASLRIRFRYAAGWADGVAIDNVRIYGEKPLNTSFSWTAPNVDVFAANCTDPYEPGSSACFRPTLSQVESQEEWTITATATLSNGCDANGTITIPNNSKIWNTTSSTNWNTANWKPGSTPSTFSGAPDNTKCVIIKQPVTIGSGLANAAKNITVKSGGSLQIGSGNALTVADFIKNETGNANNLTVASGGSLLQTTTTPNLAANGLIRADRYVTDMDNLANKMDYVYWSSPVAGQNIRSFSVGTPWNRRFEYNQATDYFVPTSNAEFVAGKGYALSAEIPNAETSPEVVNGSYNKTYKFIGVPNNGDISYPIHRTSAANSGAGTGYNLIGNPYPSNINFNELYYGNSSLIYNTAWFWTNNTYTQNQQGSGYNGNNYAVYNGTGGNPATYTSTYTGSLAPNGNIQVGQGFIIQKKDVGNGSIQFRNSYATGHDLRVASSGPFFQKNELNNRFWIRMISPNNLVNTQLVGYIDGATNGYEQDYDAEAFDTSSDMFYSVLEGKKLLIQGKDAAFTDEDIVPLGANFFSSGQYRIELENPEGIFVGSQAIYLKDKLLNIYTNLKEGGYVFATNAGLAEGRFEIVYQPSATLGNSESGVSGIQVYRSSGDFVVKSSGSNIKEVEVYDMSGRLIRKIKGHGQEVVVPAQLLNSAGYVLKIFMSDNQIFTRKILK